MSLKKRFGRREKEFLKEKNNELEKKEIEISSKFDKELS